MCKQRSVPAYILHVHDFVGRTFWVCIVESGRLTISTIDLVLNCYKPVRRYIPETRVRSIRLRDMVEDGTDVTCALMECYRYGGRFECILQNRGVQRLVPVYHTLGA